jgi:hypothetical protein
MGKLRDVKKPVLTHAKTDSTRQRFLILVVGWGRSRRGGAKGICQGF